MRRSKRKQIIELPKTDPERIQYTIPAKKQPEEVPVIRQQPLEKPVEIPVKNG
jgi:hypothetical protein